MSGLFLSGPVHQGTVESADSNVDPERGRCPAFRNGRSSGRGMRRSCTRESALPIEKDRFNALKYAQSLGIRVILDSESRDFAGGARIRDALERGSDCL